MISVMVEVGDDSTLLMEELRGLRQRVAQLEAEASVWRGERAKQQEEVLRLVADCAPVMMWVSGPSAACTYFNRLWLSFRGRSLEQELGTGWTEGVHPQDRDRCVSVYLNAFQARQEFQMEYRLMRADGEYRWVVDTGAPQYGGDGNFEGFMGSAVDISDRKPVQTGTLPLTEREKQVLTLIAEGKSTKQTAALLGISYKTADSHRSKIMEKLDVHETASLVRYAIRQGLVKA